MKSLKINFGLLHFITCIGILLFAWFILMKQMEVAGFLSEAGDPLQISKFHYYSLLLIATIVLVLYFICFKFKKITTKITFGHFFHYPLRLFMLYFLTIIELLLLSGNAGILLALMIIGPFLALTIFISIPVGIYKDLKIQKNNSKNGN